MRSSLLLRIVNTVQGSEATRKGLKTCYEMILTTIKGYCLHMKMKRVPMHAYLYDYVDGLI